MRESPLPGFAGEAGFVDGRFDGRVVVAIAKCMAMVELSPVGRPRNPSTRRGKRRHASGRLIHMRAFTFPYWAVFIPLLATTSCTGRAGLITIQADDVTSSMTEIPAGDSVKLRATAWSSSGAVTRSQKLSAGLLGFRWKMSALTQGPPAASLSHGSVVHALVPGKVRVFAYGLGRGESVDIDVVWPLDSIELRFAARTVRVGDTVELIHRAHFVSGEISTERFRGYYTDGLQARSPRKGDRTLSGWSALGLHANAVPWDPPASRKLGDTVLYIAERPGVFRVGAAIYDRWAEDTLRIEPRGGVPRSFRQKPAGPLKLRPSAYACFALTFKEWTTFGDPWPPDWPAPEKYYDWVPGAIALDTTPLIRTAPGEGYRLDPARGPATRMGRFWTLLPDHALMISMLSPKEYPHEASRIPFFMRVHFEGDTAISGLAGDDERNANVYGRRIACAPVASGVPGQRDR
jgi:hypothetical protein